MAEEGTLGQARASHDDQGEPSKEELQRRMEEARESITQTVSEIKETVTNQYYSVKESVSEALDWRHYFRKSPVAFSVGALSVGFLLGYGIAGALKGSGSNDGGYPSAEESDAYARTGARPAKLDDDDEIARRTAFHGHSYAAQAIIDSPSYASESEDEDGAPSSESQHASAWTSSARAGSESHGATSEEEEPEEDKPSLLERFKETSAYDRLQKEVASLGDRFIEELSSTAHNVVLPALFSKIKELFGVDLSNKQARGQQSQQQGRPSRQEGTQQAQQAGGASGGGQRANTQSAGASASSGTGSQSSGSSYGTSENRGYGSQSQQGAAASGSSHDSVLDLDR